MTDTITERRLMGGGGPLGEGEGRREMKQLEALLVCLIVFSCYMLLRWLVVRHTEERIARELAAKRWKKDEGEK